MVHIMPIGHLFFAPRFLPREKGALGAVRCGNGGSCCSCFSFLDFVPYNTQQKLSHTHKRIISIIPCHGGEGG